MARKYRRKEQRKRRENVSTFDPALSRWQASHSWRSKRTPANSSFSSINVTELCKEFYYRIICSSDGMEVVTSLFVRGTTELQEASRILASSPNP